MQWFRLTGLDGRQEYHSVEDGDPLPEGAESMPRPPEPYETWGAEGFVSEDALRADDEAGGEHILKAHAVKQAEAALFLSGVTLTVGLIVEEAAALELDPLELAGEIHAEAASDRAAEVSRRQRKVAYRAAYGPGGG